MRYPEYDAASPHFSPTPSHERRGVCFHHTVLDFPATIAHLQAPESRVSYHVVIGADGARARLVAEEHIAWHAGVSSFQGREGCNAFLLGLAFAGDTYASPLTEAQIESALEWLSARWAKLGWSLEWMTDHRQIAPGRKDDLAASEWTKLRIRISAEFAFSLRQ
jgi:N-acetyl-anhydromuramoyl-L-alanine amidase